MNEAYIFSTQGCFYKSYARSRTSVGKLSWINFEFLMQMCSKALDV